MKLNLWNRSKPSQIIQIYGTLITIGLIVYFLIMYAVGLVHIIELRMLNFFFMAAGIYYALKQFRRTHEGHLNYFRALSLGSATGAIASGTFSLFVFLMLKVDGNLMSIIQYKAPFGAYMNPYIASFSVLFEGLLSGFGLSYILDNYMETDKATDPQGGDIPQINWNEH